MKFSSILSLLALVFIAVDRGHAGEIQIEKGISYLPNGRAEKGDLYLPVSIDAPRPAIVIMHGGGWIGDQRVSDREVNIATNLAGHGYVCFSIDYWLADPEGVKDCCWPQNIHDCKTAVRWLRAHAGKYQIDADHIGAIGGSAGGHLAAMLSVTGPECCLDPTGPLSNISARVQCAVDMYGPVDIENWLDRIPALIQSRAAAPELYKAFSVLTYVTPDDAPILILQGTNDHVVAVSQSVSLAKKLAQQGVPHHLEIIEGAGHSFDLQPEQRDLRPQVFAFFNQHLREKRTQ
jgi:acetyl esterase/lipase